MASAKRNLQRAVSRLALLAAVLAFFYDAPHLLFDADDATASDHPLYIFHAAMGIAAIVVLAAVVKRLDATAPADATSRLVAA